MAHRHTVPQVPQFLVSFTRLSDFQNWRQNGTKLKSESCIMQPFDILTDFLAFRIFDDTRFWSSVFVNIFCDSLSIFHKLAVIFHVAMEAFHDRVSNFERLCSLVIIHNKFLLPELSTMIKLYLIAIVCATRYVNSGKHYLWYAINCRLYWTYPPPLLSLSGYRPISCKHPVMSPVLE